MTPLTRRRLRLFRENRRGYWSLVLFLLLFAVSLMADFIANDKPILMEYKGSLYFPIFQFYAETEFGGDFKTEADYKDAYVAGKINEHGWMIWPPIRYSFQTINYDAIPTPSAPTRENLLGTDDQGRDVLARLIYGFRISVLFGLALTAICSVIGIMAGAIQGYFGGATDLILQRFIEIWDGLPTLYLLIILASVIQPNFWWLLGLMCLFSWMSLTQLVRAECLRTRNMDYVRAARALGVGEWTILCRHVLPNALVSAMTFIPFVLNGSVVTLTSLDFLGFGLPPGSASLGELIGQSKSNLQAPWLGITTFVTLGVMLSLFTFIGEAVRDALDPRKTLKALP